MADKEEIFSDNLDDITQRDMVPPSKDRKQNNTDGKCKAMSSSKDQMTEIASDLWDHVDNLNTWHDVTRDKAVSILREALLSEREKAIQECINIVQEFIGRTGIEAENIQNKLIDLKNGKVQ